MDSATSSYTVQDWRAQMSRSEVPTWKRATYQLLRPVWNKMAENALANRNFEPGAKCRFISERGYDLRFRRKWAVKGLDVGQVTLVVQGTGTGWDVVSWAELKPKKIIAVDLFEFDSWPSIKGYCQKTFGVEVEFVASPLEKDFGLPAESVDIVVSDAVYEHCQDLHSVMRETRRILKPGGRVYANYGPLWYCAGGDHFSGNNDLKDSYNHIVLETADYQSYVNSFKSHIDDFQGGARYIELDLFSKLSTREYVAIYRDLGYRIDDLWLEVSKRALNYMHKYNREFQWVVQNLPATCDANDLLIKAHHIRLTKN